MDAVAIERAAPVGRLLRRIDTHAVCTWTLSAALILYLGLDGGGYALPVHAETGIAVWWIVVIASAWGLLPATRLSRSGIAGALLLAACVGWTALGITWSISSGRSFEDLALVSSYLGIFVLALMIHRERAHAVKHTVAAVATSIVAVAVIALIARLWPTLIPSSRALTQFSTLTSRLSWPLNYWNGMAALMVLGLPLLLAVATSARTLKGQAAAAAGIPIVVLCGALTLSRGGIIAGAVAVVVFVLLAANRLPKLLTMAFAAAGSAALVAGAFHRHAIQKGLANAAEHHQARGMAVAIILVCAGVALAQAGIGLLVRHGTPPRVLTVSVARARVLSAVAAVVIVVAALAAGVPHHLDHAWNDFKNPVSAVANTGSAGRLSSGSGEGRYQYWVAAVHATRGHVLAGNGPGTFQLLWLPRATISSYVENAHSLYVETYAELGLIGLALLVGFFALCLVACIRLVAASENGDRTRAAGITAAFTAFLVFAAFDWIWQLAVIPAALMLLLAAVLAPRDASSHSSRRRRVPAARIAGVTAVAFGIAALVGIAFPLTTYRAVAASQAAFNAGNLPASLADAQRAVNTEPGSAAAQLQLALVLEQQHDIPAALTAATRAVHDENQNWTNWLVLSRLEAEAGHAHASVTAYEQARRLNPRSPLFRT